MIILLMLLSFTVHGEENIITFDNNLAINLSLHYQMLHFHHEGLFSSRGSKPLDAGIGFSYKRFSLGFKIQLPFTFDYNAAFSDSPAWNFHYATESINMSFDYVGDMFVANAYFTRYKHFYIEDSDVTDREIDLEILSAGLFARWIIAHERLSLRSVYTLNRRQITSSGSPLMGFCIYYNSIFSQDSRASSYEPRQHYAYTSPLIGYSYSWVSQSGFFANLDLTVGLNYGFHINENDFVLMPLMFPNFTFGYHFKTWSFNMSFDTKIFFFVHSYEADNLDWRQLIKLNVTLFKVSKRF